MRIIWFVILILFLSLSTEASKVYEKQPDASYQLVLSDTLPILVEYDAVPSYVVLGTILSEKPTIIDQLYLSNNPTDILTNDAMLKLSATCAQRKLNVLAKSDNVLGPANTNFFVQEFQTNDDFTAALWAGGAFSNAGIPLIDISGNQDDALLQNSLISTLGVTDSTGSTSLNQLNNLFNYGKVLRSIPADEETTYNLCLLIQYFGWSLVSLVFTDTDYGISGALSFAKYADQFNINITCYQVFPAFNSTYNIENNIDCISNSDARVSIVWSDFNSSLEIVEKYQTSGKLSKQIIIGSNEFLIGWGIQVKQYLQNSSLYSGLVSFMKSALFATPSPGPFTELTTCINEVNYNGSSDSLFQEVWRNVFHCELVSYEGGATNPPSDGTEYCSGGFTAGYDKNCLCPRFIPFQYSTNYSTANYGYDNFLSTYNAISLIASNCTAVSEVLGRNFCTPNATWNSIDLQKIMRSQTILGLTGTVGYNLNNALYSNYEFAQINSDGTAQTIGFHYENETLQIDENLVYWKNGSKPISGEYFYIYHRI